VRAPAEVLERGVVGRHQPRAGARLDGHVAHRHALFHVQSADGAAGVLDDAAGATTHPNPGDQRQNDILGRNAGPQPAIHADLKGLRLRSPAACIMNTAWRRRRRSQAQDYCGAPLIEFVIHVSKMMEGHREINERSTNWI
jgi:hypothetical protein